MVSFFFSVVTPTTLSVIRQVDAQNVSAGLSAYRAHCALLLYIGIVAQCFDSRHATPERI